MFWNNKSVLWVSLKNALLKLKIHTLPRTSNATLALQVVAQYLPHKFQWNISYRKHVVRNSFCWLTQTSSAEWSTGVLPFILVHARDGEAAVWIKHCLSVLASLWLHYGRARTNGTLFLWQISTSPTSLLALWTDLGDRCVSSHLLTSCCTILCLSWLSAWSHHGCCPCPSPSWPLCSSYYDLVS